MEAKFTVGELAKLTGLTKQMLIFYDREGIFCPKYVDAHNRYRYYTADQIETLDSILILREMGIPLKEIKEHMQNRTAASTLTLLQNQQNAACEKINHWNRIYHRIHKKVSDLEQFLTEDKDSSFLISCPREYLAIEPVSAPFGLSEVDLALKRLLHKAAQSQYPYYYKIGDMLHISSLLQKEYLKFEYAFLPLTEPLPPSYGNIHVKPAGTYAHAYHSGKYEEMGSTYEKLLQKIALHNLKPLEFSYEFCILDCLTTKNPKEYLTEIQILVE